MSSLREFQRVFAEAALSDSNTGIERLGVGGETVAARARFAVYCGNVRGNYRKALGATFPVIRRLIGEGFFAAAVDAFVRAHPSTRGDVNRYGGDLAEFLERYEPAGALPYLADVARLEWAIDQSNISADASALDLGLLGEVAPDAHAQLRFVLHPSAHLIRSRYPIFRIWQVNQIAWTGAQDVDLEQGPDALLVMRGDAGVTVSRVSEADATLLETLARGATLGEAAAAASAVESAFDLTVSLRRLVGDRVIVGFMASPAPASVT